MGAFLRNFGCLFLKVLCLGGLVLLLAGSALAQEQTGKKEPAPAVEKTLPREKCNIMGDLEIKEKPCEAPKPREQMRTRKSVDRTFGGQVIRAQEEQKEQKQTK